MSYTENLRTVERFSEIGWPQTPESRRIEEIISVYNETHRFTDRYVYFYDGRFYVWAKDKEDAVPQKIYVGDIINRKSYPGCAEAGILDKLEVWFANADDGWALWVSPSWPEKYPDSKVILHRISTSLDGKEKILQNSADIFQASDGAFLDILHELFPETSDVEDPEALRSRLIFPGSNFDPALLLGKIKSIDPTSYFVGKVLGEAQLLKRASYISSLFDVGASPVFIALEMRRLGFIGQYPISCGRGKKNFLDLVIEGLMEEDRYGSLIFECPNCHSLNTRPRGQLVPQCQYCGASVKCQKS
jgi:hypothetical protein